MKDVRIYTIGYGALPLDEFLAQLTSREIVCLVDVRTHPHSRFRPEFNQSQFERALNAHNISYRFMGDSLGGRPEDPHAYDSAGHVDYGKRAQAVDYQDGIDTLLIDVAQKTGPIAIMCSEGDPSKCHRSKLIGETLFKRDIDILHILPDDSDVTHWELREKLYGPQTNLFGEQLRSRGAYGPKENDDQT